MKKVYMHTINGSPAYFSGSQICYLPKSRAKNVLRESVETILEERRLSNKYRLKKGFSLTDYGYIMFYI